MESFAVVRSIFFGGTYSGSPFRTFPYCGWYVSCHVVSVAQHLRTCFSCASVSGYCCTNIWYSDISVERLSVQNVLYPGTGKSPILDTILPRVPNVFIYRGGAEYIVGTRNNRVSSAPHSALNNPHCRYFHTSHFTRAHSLVFSPPLLNHDWLDWLYLLFQSGLSSVPSYIAYPYPRKCLFTHIHGNVFLNELVSKNPSSWKRVRQRVP
jgi:hypothetical protein